MKYMTGIYWNRGSVTPDNQDSVVLQQVLTARGRVLLAAVCDGMGGLEQGEWASGYVTRRIQEWFYEFMLRAVQRKKPCWVIRRSMERLVYHMQEKILQYSIQEKISLGTTMTVLAIVEKTYFLWHLGDSRAYRIYNGRKQTKVMCVTRDHVKGRNMLTKCVGSFGYEKPDFITGNIRSGQAVLLCSDGFYHCITQQEMAEVLDPGRLREEEQITRRLREIGEACMRRGERDNLSAVYVKVTDR
ncbi:MAG: protein phosphatase 2C domain-containing protein [Lachnospiraceae bacterium]|nr:protein phosphatase 2C domain-containing protein [Lachnospiraceae bacterium]